MTPLLVLLVLSAPSFNDGLCAADALAPPLAGIGDVVAAAPASVDVDAQRASAAAAAVALVKDGDRVGLGTGRTAAKAVQALAARVKAEKLKLVCTCTSVATEQLATSLGLTVVPIDQAGALDIAIDGADEIDPALDLVKGGGGAMVRERLVERTAKRLVVIVDSEKPVDVLGRGKLPVEILKFGEPETMKRLAALGVASVELRKAADGTPFVTDNGNWIADLTLSPALRATLATAAGKKAFADSVKLMPGVVDHGLFLGMASEAFVGNADGSVQHLVRKETP